MCHTHSPQMPNDYAWKQESTADMNLETFQYTLDRFRNAIHVSIVGQGEPLLNATFYRMIEYAAIRRHMIVTSVSNGVELHDHINALVESHLHRISISINGYNKEEYQRMTGNAPEMFSLACNNTQWLIQMRNSRKSHLIVECSFIIDQENYRHIPDFIRLGERLGADCVHLINFLPAPCDGFRPQHRSLLASDQSVVGFLRSMKETTWRTGVSFPRVLDLAGQNKRCRTHFTVLRIDGNGNYSGCPIMLLKMGQQHKITDVEVWNSVFFKEMRRRFLSPAKEDLLEPCTLCPTNYRV
jgi:MoaA/NifB/PqqE/SkfB family radical SAM enzyme